MRLIDVDLYCATICKCNRRACDKAKCPIHNAPTAYDIGKIVEELEKESFTTTDTVCGGIFEAIRITSAIEIVKQGGVGKESD